MKVLLVDDVENWRVYHSQILKNMFEDAEIFEADSATQGYDKLLEHVNNPFNIIITDLQMESAFEPLLAGEWFVEQIKTFSQYSKTKIVIISASYNIEYIAEKFGVEFIRKSTAINFPDSYKIVEL